jgi:hypothetical protein
MSATKKRREGFAMVPNRIARCGALTPKAMVVYLCLKSHAGTSGRTWLGHTTISKESHLSKSAVKAGLNELRILGLVSWKGRIRDSDGRQTTNDYRIHDSDAHLRGLFPTAPQSSRVHQVEEPSKEELLNSSFKKRARVRNEGRDDMPATSKQVTLIQILETELGTSEWQLTPIESLSQKSRKEADEIIQGLKIDKYKQELYGR